MCKDKNCFDCREKTYVAGQGVILLGGQEACIELEWCHKADMFIVDADCSNWCDDYKNFVSENYPDDDVSNTIEEAQNDCKKIAGCYFTLREINDVLKRYCDDYYDFVWEYEDGTPVE